MTNFNNQINGYQNIGNSNQLGGYQNINTQPSGPIQYPYNNFMTQQNQFNQFLKCRPVSSREEAMAFQIDLDGSLWVFPNVANGKIYTKQINNDGTATFSTYTFTADENPYNSNEYVTKNEFNKVVQSIMAAIAPQNHEGGSAGNNNQNNVVKDVPINF